VTAPSLPSLPSAETARRSHSIVSAIKSGVTVWYAVLGGIGMWTIHLLVLTSVVQFTCNAGGYEWIMHVTTLVTLAMTAVAMALSLRLVRRGREAEADGGGGGGNGSGNGGERTMFLGQLGLLIGGVNFLLIALEGLYAVLLEARRCG
jgi:hypothetical protein